MDTQQARSTSTSTSASAEQSDAQPFTYAPNQSVPTQSPKPPAPDWKPKAALVGGGLFLLAIVLGIIFLLTRNPQLTANLRDIAIIAFATISLVMSIIIGALLIVMIYYLQSLVALLRNEIKPMLANAQQTVQTVRTTTTLVSENVARPVIKMASFLAGLEGARSALRNKMGKSQNKAND